MPSATQRRHEPKNALASEAKAWSGSITPPQPLRFDDPRLLGLRRLVNPRAQRALDPCLRQLGDEIVSANCTVRFSKVLISWQRRAVSPEAARRRGGTPLVVARRRSPRTHGGGVARPRTVAPRNARQERCRASRDHARVAAARDGLLREAAGGFGRSDDLQRAPRGSGVGRATRSDRRDRLQQRRARPRSRMGSSRARSGSGPATTCTWPPASCARPSAAGSSAATERPTVSTSSCAKRVARAPASGVDALRSRQAGSTARPHPPLRWVACTPTPSRRRRHPGAPRHLQATGGRGSVHPTPYGRKRSAARTHLFDPSPRLRHAEIHALGKHAGERQRRGP